MRQMHPHYRMLLLSESSAGWFRAEALDQLGGLMGRW